MQCSVYYEGEIGDSQPSIPAVWLLKVCEETVLHMMGVQGMPTSPSDAWGSWKENMILKTDLKSWNMVIICICWHIWLERNGKIFRDEKHTDMAIIFQSV